MGRFFLSLFVVLLLLVAAYPGPAGSNPEEGFNPLFNGKNLSGWVNVNCAPNTFTVRDGMIVSTGVPTGVMRTKRMYENFILELDWKHLVKGGNAGLFVHSGPLPVRGQPFTRAIEVQIIDGNHPEGLWTGHGDVFAIQGATFVPDRPHPQGWMRCLPSERRANPAGQWNHYRVECIDGRVALAVNGKVVSGGSKCSERKGYICLESEGTECHFKNIRIKELPSSNPPPTEAAEADKGFKSLYSGIDLKGWKVPAESTSRWQPKDWVLTNTGKAERAQGPLWTTKEYGNFILMADWRYPSVAQAKGDSPTPGPSWPGGTSAIFLRGDPRYSVGIASSTSGSGMVFGGKRGGEAVSAPHIRADRPAKEWNRFVITVRGDRVTVVLNDQTVAENVRMPGVPRRGPIGLRDTGDPIEFANLYVKPL